jgi:aminoglycoside phosphotransferase (APT) family kinase protein
MKTDQKALKAHIQELLGKEITQFNLKGKGCCNNAYYLQTNDGAQYIVKQERSDKEMYEQNTLQVEAKVAKQLHDLGFSTPKVVLTSEEPMMYGYEFIEGEMLIDVWKALTEEEKISICHELGAFHAGISKKFTKDMSVTAGVRISTLKGLHPEVLDDYNRLILRPDTPTQFISLVKRAKSIFDETINEVHFHFLHNDLHHENVIIKDKKISGVIDFGDSEYGETAKEFSRYVRDFPGHFMHIITTYEEKTGNKLPQKRIISNALISDFVDQVEAYQKGGEHREKAEQAMETYSRLLG